jgi:hypothetical protein
MADPKTVRGEAGVADFLAAVADPQRRADAQAACAVLAEVTGQPPVLWGSGIVGFGSYDYRYPSGRSGTFPAVGLSPRKQALTIYVAAGFAEFEPLLKRLGPHTVGTGCLYLKRLSDVDETVLRELIDRGFRALNGTGSR